MAIAPAIRSPALSLSNYLVTSIGAVTGVTQKKATSLGEHAPMLRGWLKQCPLYPQKRTWISRAVMSALCQKQTFCTALKNAVYSITSSATVKTSGGIL